MNRSEELVKNTAIISIGKLSTQVISFLLLPLYTSRLAIEEYGNFDFVVTIATFLVPVMTMLMEESMFRFLVDCKTEKEKREIISQTFLLSILSTIIITIFVITLIFIFDYKLGYPILVYSYSLLFISLSNALSRGTGKITLYAWSNFISSFGIITLNIIFILGFHMGFSAMLLSGVISNTLVAFGVFIMLKVWRYIRIREFNLSKTKSMLKYSIPLVPNSISWNVINASDRLVLISFLGARANGLYSISYKFPNLINMFYNIFNIAWRETSAKMVRDNDQEQFHKIYAVIKNGLISTVILLICVIPFVYPVLINKNYQPSIVYIPILAVSIYYLSLSAFFGSIFTAYHDTYILGTTSFVAAAINIIVNLALIKFIGIYAAAISTLVSAYYLYFYRKVKLRKYMDTSDKKDPLVLLYFAVLVILFLKPNIYVQFIELIVALLVSIILNRDMLLGFRNMVVKNKN